MSTPIGTLKEEVEAFTLTMLYKLGLHRQKGHWSSYTNEQLIGYLKEEIEELEEAIKSGNREKICSEAGDLGNVALFIHNNAINGAKNKES